MCMNCNNSRSPLKKIILLLAITIGIGVIIYFPFVLTSNPTIAASISLILSFAACPLMCVVMGGFMVVMNQNKKEIEIAKERINPLG